MRSGYNIKKKKLWEGLSKLPAKYFVPKQQVKSDIPTPSPSTTPAPTVNNKPKVTHDNSMKEIEAKERIADQLAEFNRNMNRTFDKAHRDAVLDLRRRLSDIKPPEIKLPPKKETGFMDFITSPLGVGLAAIGGSLGYIFGQKWADENKSQQNEGE